MNFLPSSNFATRSPSESLAMDDDAVADALAFLDEATSGATRLREPLRIEVVRTLTDEDISGGFLTPSAPPSLREIKASHHSLEVFHVIPIRP